MSFHKYLHIEKLGREEVNGILNGKCYIFPKLDGSNCCVWYDGMVRCGSRTRELSMTTSDNAGFRAYVNGNSSAAAQLRQLAEENPGYVFYGEWLGTKNHIRDYLESDVLFIFDVYDVENDRYLAYDEYVSILDAIGYEYIVRPLGIIDNPTMTAIEELLTSNHYNLPPTVLGEGVVIKNYDYRNSWGHYCVAKVVTEEYLNIKHTGKPAVNLDQIEEAIADKYVTEAVIDKTYWKVIHDACVEEFNPKLIGALLNRLYEEFLNEDLLDAIRAFKNPTIDFSRLRFLVFQKGRKFLNLV